MHFGNLLRQRQRIDRRIADPVRHQRDAIEQHRYELGFLRIADAAVAQVGLPRRLLLGDEQTRRLREQRTQVVVDHGRDRIEPGDRGLLGHRYQRTIDLLHDVLELRSGVIRRAPLTDFDFRQFDAVLRIVGWRRGILRTDAGYRALSDCERKCTHDNNCLVHFFLEGDP